MEPARPLREVFAELIQDEGARQAYAADPGGFLAASGHPALSGDQVVEAITSFADSASPIVAEHLAPFVMAHSVVRGDAAVVETDPAQGLDLLAVAPTGLDPGDLPAGLDDEIPGGLADAPEPAYAAEPPVDLGFGSGAEGTQPLGRDQPEATPPPVEPMPDLDADVEDLEPTDGVLMDRPDLQAPDDSDVDGDVIE